MQIVKTLVSRRQEPPCLSVEFLGSDGEKITIDMRGDGSDADDLEAVRRAKSVISNIEEFRASEPG